MADPACQHKRTQLIAKDNEAQYIECLDCGEILETGEMQKPPKPGETKAEEAKKKSAGFDESLSDA
jgi:transcription initiation factor TFIIIB Brf1 subunit/transcription initiation factor TFIIB